MEQGLWDSDGWNSFFLEVGDYSNGPSVKVLLVFYHQETDTLVMEPLIDVGFEESFRTA